MPVFPDPACWVTPVTSFWFPLLYGKRLELSGGVLLVEF